MAGGSADVALALRTLALKDRCSHCGKQREGLKKCSVCKQASYCGAECQNAGWKKHKKTCAPPQPLNDVFAKVTAAHAAGDWRGVLEWEGRMEELLEGLPDELCNSNFRIFTSAYRFGFTSTGITGHLISAVRLLERHITLLGKMERFRDQGIALCHLASHLNILGRGKEAASQYERARDVGAAHGFFSVECKSCHGLGRLAINEGRDEEGVALLRNALAAAPLSEDENPAEELGVLNILINALFATRAIDEVEPLVLRYRAAAREECRRWEGNSDVHGLRMRGMLFFELQGICASAQLHEARGRPQEAEREVRALLVLMRENPAALHASLGACQELLLELSASLNILDAEIGEEELIAAVGAELAHLREMAGTAHFRSKVDPVSALKLTDLYPETQDVNLRIVGQRD